MQENRCNFCKKEIQTNCDWNQGRCPHRPSMIDEILLDKHKTRFYNLIKSITSLFKK